MTPQPLGQHFLADPAWRARILERIAPALDQVWLEIGAGGGEMTRELAARVDRVVAIELDARLVEKLRVVASGLNNVEVVSGDVLAVDILRLAGPRFRVYGSLPYYITSPILRRLFAIAEHIDEIDVVIQWEVARRLAALPGSRDYGWLSVAAQYRTRPGILLKIPPGAFQPAPKVDSALVRLQPPGEKERLGMADADDEPFLEFAGWCFAQKRKTLVNNLKMRYGAEAVRDSLAALGRGQKARAEELAVADLAQVWKRLEA